LVIIPLKPLAGESNHVTLRLGDGFRTTSLKAAPMWGPGEKTSG
jgi:hypothetical protein